MNVSIHIRVVALVLLCAHTPIKGQEFLGDYISSMEQKFGGRNKGKGSGYGVYRRAIDEYQYHVDQNGILYNFSAQTMKGMVGFLKSGATRMQRSHSGHWEFHAPRYSEPNSNGQGLGRVNVLVSDPQQPSRMFAGTPAGGLWLSPSGGGNNWEPLTDGMPNLGISGIAIDHTNSDIIYILTGDGDGKHTPSIGVLKSTNGGQTWLPTGLTFGPSQSVYGFKLIMHHSNPEILLAATDNGIYRTHDGGVNWQLVLDILTYDIEQHPESDSIFYAASNNRVRRSIDVGLSFTEEANFSPWTVSDSRVALGVTPFGPDFVYAAVADDSIGYQGLFISRNRGENWITFDANSSPPDIMGGEIGGGGNHQPLWDFALAISPNDTNRVFIGGINIWTTPDMGTNWFQSSHQRVVDTIPYVHADVHYLGYMPDGALYAGCDGGVWRTSNNGTTWLDRSEGLAIMQLYGLGLVSQTQIYSGAQDNGVNAYEGTDSLRVIVRGDGMDTHIDPANVQILYSATQYGRIVKSLDGGNTFVQIVPSNSNDIDFRTPYLPRQGLPNRLLRARRGMIEEFDTAGVLIRTIEIPDVSIPRVLRQSVGSGNTVYVSAFDSLYVCQNYNSSNPVFATISNGLPGLFISDIAIDPSDPGHVFICFGGYVDSVKVYESFNYGTDWAPVSEGLPNIPMRCLRFDPSSIQNAIYLGSSIGVFYRDEMSSVWKFFSNGLPTVAVNELEIDTTEHRIYAATYGRGLWSTQTFSECPVSYNLTPLNDPSSTFYTGTQRYSASSSITSTRTVTGGTGSDVRYRAGDSVKMLPGFHAREYNRFQALIGNCDEAFVDPLVVLPSGIPDYDLYLKVFEHTVQSEKN